MSSFETGNNTLSQSKENLQSIKDKFPDIYNDSFESFFLDLDTSKQNDLVSIITDDKNKKYIDNYLENNLFSFPINEEGMKRFLTPLQENNIDNKKEKQVSINHQKVFNYKKEYYLSLKNFTKNSNIQELKYFVDLLGSFEKGNDDLFTKLVNFLENKENLKKVYLALQEIDEKNQEKGIKKNLSRGFRDFVVSIKPNLSPVFGEVPLKNFYVDRTLLEQAELSALIPQGAEKKGNIIEGKNENGDKITVVLSGDGYKRFIGDKYKLETPFGIRDFYKSVEKFERYKKEKAPELEEYNTQINGIEGILQQFFGEDSGDWEEKKEAIKNILSSYHINITDIDFDSFEEAKISFQGLLEKKKEKLNDLQKKIENKYKSYLRDEVNKYKKSIQEKDEKQKQTLEFLHSIGFDLIPQRFTDQLFDEINSDIGGLRGMIDLGDGMRLTEDIDLKNGSFGAKETENEREVFVRFFNKLVSGDPEEPLSIATFLSEEKDAQSDRQKLIDAFKSGGIMNENGSFIYRQMRENLKNTKVEKSE